MTGIALIGCGKWGKNYLNTIDAIPNARLLYVCDLHQEAQQLVKLNFPDIKVVEDYQIVLQDSAVKAVIIATPPLSHYEIAANCMTNGKAVLIEKPITTNVAETIGLMKIANETNQILMTGHLMLYHPAVETIKNYISEGVLGDIKFLSFERANANIFRRDIDVIGDLSIHDLAVLLYLLEQQPQWVSACGIKVADDLPIGTVSIDIGFSDNTMAHIQGNWHYHKKTRSASVLGTRGMMNFDDTEEINKKLTFITSEGEIRRLIIDKQQPLNRQCEHFINCVCNKTSPRTGSDNALKVMKLIDAIMLSIMKKRTIYLKE
jgi:predicted dehydrogenase